jgi:hypothetical protein
MLESGNILNFCGCLTKLECVPYDAQFSLPWEITKESEYRHTRTSFTKRGLDLVIVGLDLVKAGLDLTSPFIIVVEKMARLDASWKIYTLLMP